MANIPHTGQGEWAAEQASPWVQVNLVLRALASFAATAIVQSRALTSAPASCNDGDVYWVAGLGGLWSTFAIGDLAISLGANAVNGWAKIAKADVERTGVKLYVVDEHTSTRFWGSWIDGVDVFVSTSGAPDGGSVKWDASNGTFYIG